MHNPFKAQVVSQSLHAVLERMRKRLPQGLQLNGAILDSKGELLDGLVYNTLHITTFEPIVRSVKTYFTPKINEVFVTNDPFSGNTRLSDLTLIQGAFGTYAANELRYFIAAQISLPVIIGKNWTGLFSTHEEEGYRIPPSPLDQGTLVNPALLDYIAQSGFDREELSKILGDVKIALKKATLELISLEASHTRDAFQKALEDLKKYSENQMRLALREIPDGDYEAQDFLDNDGLTATPIKIQCRLKVQGENILLNFSGSSKQTAGPYNCSYALTLAACFATLRGLVKKEIPLNSGAFRTFSIEAQEGTIVNAAYPRALIGGYFETTHRISDVVKACLSKALPHVIPSLGGGSSSPVLMRFISNSKSSRLLIETLGCGGGASHLNDGCDAVKTEFDNEPAFSVEELEEKFPLQVIQHSLRDSTHGDGKHQGGRAITRGYKFLETTQLMLLADRHSTKIQGFYGGTSGVPGEVILLKKGEKKKAGSFGKALVQVEAGDTLFISSSSGAGWGKSEKEPEAD